MAEFPPKPPFLGDEEEKKSNPPRETGLPTESPRETPRDNAEELPQDPIEREFQKKFGVKPEDLEKLEGYKDLSEGRKILVLENLKQITLGRIQEEADSRYKEHNEKAGFLGRLWNGISRHYQIAKHKKSSIEDFEKGGVALHGEILKQLTNGAALGPEAVKTAEGKIEIQHLTSKMVEERMARPLSEEEKENVTATNAAYSEFARIPYEWSLDSASGHEKEKYIKAREKFELANDQLMDLLTAAGGKRLEAFSLMNKVSGEIRLNQFLSANPDVEEALYRIKSKPAWVSLLKETATERGLYFAGGFALRSAAVGMLGFIGAPLAAASIGGISAYRRGREQIKTEGKGARGGLTRRERRHEISALTPEAKEKILEEIRNAEYSPEEAQQKLEEKFGELTRVTTERQKKSEAKEAVKKRHLTDAETLIARLKKLTDKILAEDTPRELQLEYLARLSDLTQEKINKGLVNFGTIDKRSSQQYQLIQNLSIAETLLVKNRYFRDGVDERVERLLDLRQEKISAEKKRYIVRQVAKGAGLAAGFAFAGAAARHLIDVFGQSGTVDTSGQVRGASAPSGAPELPTDPLEQYKMFLDLELQKKVGRVPSNEEISAIFEGQKAGKISSEEMAQILEKMKVGPLSQDEIKELYLGEEKGLGAGIPEKSGHAPEEITPPEAEKSTEKPEMKTADRAATIPEGERIISYTETAKAGDSVWKMTERKLGEVFGDEFKKLDRAQRVYIIDAIKDVIVENPQDFDLKDADQIKPGFKLDLSHLLGSKEYTSELFNNAKTLSEADLESIKKNLLIDWVHAHPGQRLTPAVEKEMFEGYDLKYIAPEEAPEPRTTRPEIPDVEQAETLLESHKTPTLPERTVKSEIPNVEEEVQTFKKPIDTAGPPQVQYEPAPPQSYDLSEAYAEPPSENIEEVQTFKKPVDTAGPPEVHREETVGAPAEKTSSVDAISPAEGQVSEKIPGGTKPAEAVLPHEEPRTEEGGQVLGPSAIGSESVFEAPLEGAIVKAAIGFKPEEYAVIKNMRIEDLLLQIPESRDEAWAIWRGEVAGKTITMPHHGVQGPMEFEKQMRLADFIRRFKPDKTQMRFTISEFLKSRG